LSFRVRVFVMWCQ